MIELSESAHRNGTFRMSDSEPIDGQERRATPHGSVEAIREQPCVLIVEDDPDDRDIYGIVLCKNGFNVLFAEDYHAGLQLARAVRPDAILLDLGLPGEHTGLELCLAVRRSHSTARLPIVVLTGFPEARLGDAARLAGCTTYMEKPASPLDVLREVRRLIAVDGTSLD